MPLEPEDYIKVAMDTPTRFSLRLSKNALHRQHAKAVHVCTIDRLNSRDAARRLNVKTTLLYKGGGDPRDIKTEPQCFTLQV